MVTQIDTGNTIGWTRELDDLNRVVIPMEIIKEQKPNLKSKRVALFPLKNGIYVQFDKNLED